MVPCGELRPHRSVPSSHALVVFLSVTGVPQYATALLMDRSIAPYYLRPAVAAAAERPHNLVTIYLESGENTFADTSVFGQNLLSELDRATAGWARYDGLEQYPGGGWTMSGLVSTGCGIPLKSQLLTDGMNLNNLGEALTTYLPGATCLGDILSEQGYTNVFMGGAHTRFAGKDTYLSTHGYDRVLGLDEWEADGEARSQISVWGLSDRRLFGRAADVVDDLDESGRPFNLTLLTLDTHEPGGVFPGCSTDDDLAMATATKCSMRAVAGFIDHLESRGILDDTVVTVMGDHLKATSEGGFFKDELERTPNRTIIYRVWSPDGVRFTRDRADQLSVLPTTLELLGLGAARRACRPRGLLRRAARPRRYRARARRGRVPGRGDVTVVWPLSGAVGWAGAGERPCTDGDTAVSPLHRSGSDTLRLLVDRAARRTRSRKPQRFLIH